MLPNLQSPRFYWIYLTHRRNTRCHASL